MEPATGEPLARAAMAGEADVDRAVEAARAAVEGDWGRTPGTERARLLHALADAIVANRAELAELEARNVGKAISSVKAELHQAVENFRYYGSAIATIGGRANPIGGSLLFYSLKEPVGVAAQIVPWNYPLMMATWKLAPALAAGCSVVLKPDPQTPLTALRLAELAAEVGFPAGALNVVPGDGPTTGAYLVKHPGVDKVAFTGSTKTGGEIMRLASDPVKRVTLELGGKSPNLVFADADLASALPSSAWSIFYAAGQSCEARSRMLVEKPLYDEAVAKMAELAGAIKVGDPLDAETQMGSLVSTCSSRAGARLRRACNRLRGRRRRLRPGRGGSVLSADRGCDDQRRGDRAGGGLRPGRHGHPVRGREGRDSDRERRPLRAHGDRLDGRPGARPSHCGADQVGHGRDQHAVHRISGNPVRRLQAVRLRARARARDARSLPRDEERRRLDGRAADQPLRAVERPSYRWAVLAAGTFSTASISALVIGLPVLVPTLRDEYALSLGEIGVLLASEWVGTTLALLPWGLAADRFGERIVLTVGLTASAAFIVGAAFAESFGALLVLLALAGAAGASVNSSSGRAVMHWFDASERGLALGVRQTAIPIGGFVGALALPPIAESGGSEAAFLFLAALCVVGALVGGLVLRERKHEEELEVSSLLSTLRDRKLWRLSLGSGLYLYAQLAVLGFAVVFLHDEHGLSESRAALAVAASQVLAMGLRIGVGRWSDLVGSRIGPLLRVGVAISSVVGAVAVLASGPIWLLVPALAVAGGLSMAWNGLSFTTAAELAGRVRSGAAIGLQQTVLGGAGIVSPVLFAALVSATSWHAAFAVAAVVPLAGVWTLLPLRRG